MALIKEQPGQVSFGRAVKDYVKGYFDFRGRTTRAGYWWMVLVGLLAVLIVTTLMLSLVWGLLQSLDFANQKDPQVIGQIMATAGLPFLLLFFFGSATALLLVIPTLALVLRRFRDAGLTGWGGLLVLGLAELNDLTHFSAGSNLGTAVSAISLVATLLWILLTLLPTDCLVTRSNNKFVQIWFRPAPGRADV